MPVRVYLEDTDAGGIVYHASYLRFMERARTEWLRALGVALPAWHARERRLFVVRSMTVEWLAPARFDDELDVGVKPVTLGRASLVLEQPVTRAGAPVALGSARLACIDADTLSPVAIPPAIREALNRER